jgi:hypothetical protein
MVSKDVSKPGALSTLAKGYKRKIKLTDFSFENVMIAVVVINIKHTAPKIVLL